MRKRTLKVALLAALATILVLSFSSVALADQTWSDLPDTVTAKYGITDNQVASISDGFPDGTWKPYQAVTRAQFTKMAVMAFGIPLANPATPSFTDVPKTHIHYQYIEGAKAAGVVNGTTATTFGPSEMITRAQAAAIVSRYVAQANGYNLATMYTTAQIDALLAHFGDAASISSALRAEVAFAYDMGITMGDAYGNFNPQANMMRIQGAAFLIRAQLLVPPANWTAADIEQVTADKSENLIGKTHSATFKVTTADGHPAKNVLVDFDVAYADPFYVGNVSPQAAMTDSMGMVTVNLNSAEPGTQRLYATIVTPDGLMTEMATKYWLALDEVYLTDPEGEMDPADLNESRNNAGDDHTFCYRVVVFGPGPLSTSQYDWYNVYNPDADPADIDEWDGYDWFSVMDDAAYDYAAELHILSEGDLPRTMAGVDLEWMVDWSLLGGAEGTYTGDDMTDADGLGCITLSSDVIGTVEVSVVADYPENPYPKQLFLHSTFQPWTGHDYDWGDQPSDVEDYAYKTWIPHSHGGGDSPISPASPVYTNIGEEHILTLTLVDEFGNPIAGKQVEWFMQGVGHFVTDDENTITDPTNPAGNIDFDVTDANGECRVMVKSLEAGEQIVHAKFRDKGVGGAEGAFITYDAEVQWFDVNVATFDDPTTDDNEALAKNMVGTEHTFTLNVMGLKLELDPSIDNPKQQTPYIDTDYPGSAYDGIFDYKDAEYFGGILLATPADYKQGQSGGYTVTVQGREILVTLDGAITEFDWDKDGYMESFTGQTGIYLPLEGKDVTFAMVDNYIGEMFDEDGMVESVGGFTPDSAVTDENGQAQVTVTSTVKGPQTIEATVDWEDNPHNLSELVRAYAKKIWYAEGWDKVVVTIDGQEVANSDVGEVSTQVNPWYIWDPNFYGQNEGEWVLNTANIEVHVYDANGNDLPDYEVVYLLENLGTVMPGSQGAADTYLPLTYLADLDEENDNYDTNAERPDANEPMPECDPYATIVGDGGTPSFFFNQWLGSDKPAYLADDGNWYGGQDGVVRWPVGRQSGWDFNDYRDDVHGWQLITDGAKAWTMDGFFCTEDGIAPNLLTGSNIDLVLAEEYAEYDDGGALVGGALTSGATHFKSIVKIMVYAPADGLVIDQAPIWHYQVHKVWENPVPSEIILEPEVDYAIAGVEEQSVTATVLDQFGLPVPNADLDLQAFVLEGTGLTEGWVGLEDVTDVNGQVTFTWGEDAGDWGVQQVAVFWDPEDDDNWAGDELTSNLSTIQWIYDDRTAAIGLDLIEAVEGEQKVTIQAGNPLWPGYSLTVHLNPGAASIGGPAPYTGSQLAVSISTAAGTWELNEPFFVASSSNNTDGVPNWVYDVVGAGAIAQEFIGSTSGGTAAEATVSANIPAGTADDDLMLALVESYQSSGTPVQPSTVPTGWSLIATQTVGECNFSVYYKVASGDTPGTSRTWGYAGIKDYIATNIVTYRGGFSVASPIQGSSNTAYTNADLILRAASVTTSAPQTNLILVGGAYLSGTFRTVTPPADFTEDLDWAPASPYFLRYFAHSTAPQAAAGASGDKDATMSGSGSVALKHAVLIALNP